MTPEELTEARETIGSDCQESDLVCAIQEAGQSLLAYIDQQAAEIEILKMGEKAADRLILRGRQCEEQIEALKEKLVEERAHVLAGRGNLLWEPLPKEDRPDGLYPALTIRGKTYWRNQARQQLAEEMPEVDWQ